MQWIQGRQSRLGQQCGDLGALGQGFASQERCRVQQPERGVGEHPGVLIGQFRAQSAQHVDPDLDIGTLQAPDLATGLGRKPVEFVQVDGDDGRRGQREVDVELDQSAHRGPRVIAVPVGVLFSA